MRNVLIVDDKEENLHYLDALFSSHGYVVASAHHGAEALAKARQTPPDIVISDLLMPVMDGYTLLRHWKADARLKHIPFVVFTATYTETEDEDLARSMGADGFILKPCGPAIFLARIEEINARAAKAGPVLADSASSQQGELMQHYSKALIRKLEEKSLQLEVSNRALQADIAERSKAENLLRLLMSAVLQSNESILITDAQLDPPGPHIVFANPAFTLLTGHGCEEVIGKNPRILQGPGTDRTILQRLRRNLEQGEKFEGIAVQYRKDGSEYEQEWQVEPIRDASGTITHYVALQRDITERTRALEALRASEANQRQLAQALEGERTRLLAAQRVANMGDWETDLATMDVTWSEETYRIHEMDPSCFRPTHAAFLELVHPEDRDRVAQSFLDSLVRPAASMIEHRLLLGEGHVKYVEQHWTAIFDEHDAAVRAIGTCQDITERKLAEIQIRESRDRLKLATQAAQIGIWDWDVRTNTLIWDARMYELFGVSYAQFSGAFEAWQKIFHPDDQKYAEAEMSAALAGTRDFDSEFRVKWPGGEVRHIKAHALVQRDQDGTATRMIGVNWDITESKRAEIRIRYLSRVHAMLSAINTLIVRVRDRDELFKGACRIAVEEGKFRMAMIAIADPVDGAVAPVASAGDDDGILDAIRTVLASPEQAPNSMVIRAMRQKTELLSNNSTNDSQLLLARQCAEAGIRSVAVMPLIVADEAIGVFALHASENEFFHAEEMKLLREMAGDIAFAIDHIAQQERLEYLAYYDEITGLPNRTLFLDRVAQFMRSSIGRGHKLALFLIDLERFRNINDSLGRAAGDALLRHVADWLSNNARDQSLVARVGADHFAIVMPEIRPDGNLEGLLEQTIAKFVQHVFHLEGAPFRIAAKVGVAVFPDDGDRADLLLRNAEAALKQAKASGHRHMFYQASMNESVAVRLALENDLRLALDNHEFVLHYQPKVTLDTGQLTGAEALLRWNRPQIGLVLPGQFVPLLEETGLIHEVGRWAIKQAIADYLRWKRAGLPVKPIAVNVSSLQLRNRGFIAEIEQLISIDPAAAAGLQLEITESMVMQDIRHGISTLQAIRAMGVTVALDDFGTGFSSLSYLSKLPLDVLKIDRSFIDEMTDSPEGLSLVSSMIGLAHTLSLKVVAEGVETEDQSRLLHLLRCDEMQGFLHSKPVPSDLFERNFLMQSALAHLDGM